MRTNSRGLPPALDVDKWLENLLLDKHRAAYHAMTPDQKTCVRFAYNSGFLTPDQKKRAVGHDATLNLWEHRDDDEQE